MKTAQSYVDEYANQSPMSDKTLADYIREAQTEAIEADREHLLNYVQTVHLGSNMVIVDELTIINAPNILLE